MFIKNLFNSLDFWLRRKIKFTRGIYCIKNEPKIELFDHLNNKDSQAAELKEREYFQRYNLYKLKDNSTRRNYLENLYTIELLEQNLNPSPSNKDISTLDIGSKNWFYAEGEYNFFKYANFDTDVCKWIDQFSQVKKSEISSGISCKNETKNYYVLAQGSQFTTINPEAIWPDLTSKLRLT